MIQGTEEGHEERHLAWYGFVQPLYEAILADEVTGLSGALEPYEGRPIAVNTLGGGDAQSTFSIRRARLGVRGLAPGAEELVNYHFSVEAGINGLTLGDGVRIADASVTLSSPWGPRLRFGQFKLPTADEAIEAVHVSADLVNYSPVVARLLSERPVTDGIVAGPAYGFRDIGVELFNAPTIGDVEIGYAAFVSNGRMGGFDFDPYVDVGGKLQLSWLLDDRQHHPERDELSLAVWGLTGKRRLEPGRVKDRHRAGTSLQFRLAPVRLRIEGLWGEGVIPGGPSPPFRGNAVGLLDDPVAYGGTLLSGVRPVSWLEGDLGLNYLRVAPGGAAERVSWEAVMGLQFFASGSAKLAVDFALRRIEAPHAATEVQRLLDTVGPRVSVQATVRF
jgi:hypothetical protein